MDRKSTNSHNTQMTVHKPLQLAVILAMTYHSMTKYSSPMIPLPTQQN